METRFETTNKYLIQAPVDKVWKALTTPEIVEKYFFGTQLITSWKLGDPIVFQGEWEGKSYQDRGTVLEYEPNHRLMYSYLSSWSGKEDRPENYLRIIYEVKPIGDNTELIIRQSNYDEERANHSEGNWDAIIQAMKEVIE